MRQTFKYRIYPSKNQEKLLSQFFGNCRFVFNKCLDYKKSNYDKYKTNISLNTLASSYLQSLKQENDWLKVSPSQSLQSSIRYLDSAYQRFFKKLASFPKFKNKFAKQSLAFPQGVSVDWKNNKIIFPKLKQISAVLHRQFSGIIKTVHLSKEKDGKYYACILVENDSKPMPKKQLNNLNQVIALDLGLKHFSTDNRGNKIDNPRFLNNVIDRIKFYQSTESRKKKGSNNKKKIRRKINNLYCKLTRQRENFLHQLSSRIISENQVIILEDLDVKNLLKSSYTSIARNIGDVSWSRFISFLKYKAEWYGKELVQIDKFEPSSKLCSNCKHKNQELKLADRTWICDNCGTKHDRDINAAKNILEIGLKKIGREDIMVQGRKGSFNLGKHFAEQEAACL